MCRYFFQKKNLRFETLKSNNIPYHSKHVASSGPKLLAYLKEIITNAKARSLKWLSTSVPHSDWSSPKARASSAEYHANSFLRPVLFAETIALIPKDAITIEIGPHDIMKAVIGAHRNLTNLSFTRSDQDNTVETVLRTLGKLFNLGLHPQFDKLYPSIQFPVSRTTPMISPLIKWDHSEDLYTVIFDGLDMLEVGSKVINVDLNDVDYMYMKGHVIDGRTLLPATGYLVLVWELLATLQRVVYNDFSVVFENVRFMRATNLPAKGHVTLMLAIQKGNPRTHGTTCPFLTLA